MSELIYKAAAPKRGRTPESMLREAVATYLAAKHPKLIWFFDLAGEHKLSKAAAARQKLLRNGRYALPDLHILEPRGDYHGCFLELKAIEARAFKKDGSPADAHVIKQDLCLRALRERGYYAEFAQGLDAVLFHIEKYLSL